MSVSQQRLPEFIQVQYPVQEVERLNKKALKKNDPTNDTKAKLRYAELLEQLKGSGALWEDPDFPADNSMLFVNDLDNTDIIWKRPKEIKKDAVLVHGGQTRTDVKMTDSVDFELTRFLTALTSITVYKPLFHNVVPNDQDFKDNYIGAFKFRFWRSGKWQEVVVDDRLPTLDNKLQFVFSTSDAEFWSALALKAYAKLNGTYEEVLKVSQAEAMQDLTGGICSKYSLNEKEITDNLYSQMLKFWSQSCLISCVMERSGLLPTTKAKGIQGLESYSITNVLLMNLTDGRTEKLLRIYNPNVSLGEFTGTWSDNSELWKLVSANDKRKYNIVKSDGEFWMPYHEFIKIFTNLVVCHLGPESLENGKNDKLRWDITRYKGTWVRYVNSGGSRNNMNLYVTNPQYRIEVRDTDEEDDIVTIIVGLTQIDSTQENFQNFNVIGYDIYQLDDPARVLDNIFFKKNRPICDKTTYLGTRDISSSHQIPVGHYVIVPSTFDPDKAGDFLLRIGARNLKSMEIDEFIGRKDISFALEKRISSLSIDNLSKELQGIFDKISLSKGSIDSFELMALLNAILSKDTQCIKLKTFEGFTLDDCRSMIASYDYDKSGRMEFREFVLLMKNFRIWKSVFKDFDTDDNGVFNSYEYRRAISYCGFSINNNLHCVLVTRYVDPRNGHITFEDFIMSLVRLTKSFDSLEELAKDSYYEKLFNPYWCMDSIMSM